MLHPSDPQLSVQQAWEMMPQAPEALLENPALSLWLLEDPMLALKLVGNCRAFVLEHQRGLTGQSAPMHLVRFPSPTNLALDAGFNGYRYEEGFEPTPYDDVWFLLDVDAEHSSWPWEPACSWVDLFMEGSDDSHGGVTLIPGHFYSPIFGTGPLLRGMPCEV